MKALVVYDSKWGNTEKIAKAIAAGIGGDCKVARVGTSDAKRDDNVDLIVLGSPILGGRPSESIQQYINGISSAFAGRLKVATFDTRLLMKFAKLFGYASVRMAKELKGKGCTVVSEAQGYIVEGRSGPLASGEVERAMQWGKALSKM
jgi:flavodoxin